MELHAVVVVVVSVTLIAPARGLMTPTQKKVILNEHNEKRRHVDPPPVKTLAPLEWCNKMENLAWNYAKLCRWEHSKHKDVGENLYVNTGPLQPKHVVEKWNSEHKNYNYHNNSCNKGKMCGHYTQMVWAKTKQLGCAAHFCANITGLEYENVTLVVCNYKPSGNIIGMKPYEASELVSESETSLDTTQLNAYGVAAQYCAGAPFLYVLLTVLCAMFL
uniref:peptidase inhibitor 16-like n=1 Tax=Myxine glutinosa TaxID=7769 RepID=UPI00358DF197